jgi:hypothetical protein
LSAARELAERGIEPSDVLTDDGLAETMAIEERV